MGITQLRQKAEELFGKGNFSEFCETDPFNPKNEVRGFISRRSTELYGALFICFVNSREAPQLIYGTPKMHYPFDRSGSWAFPSARKIEIYEKLDGTNILAFVYHDENGRQYLSYKTRLRPFIGKISRFGRFMDMWQEVLVRYPQIPQLVRDNQCNISFELYGARNKHLVEYQIPLDVALLFGISSSGNILSPSQLKTLDVPTAPFYGQVTGNYVWEYQQLQKKLEDGISKTEDGYSGSEGAVWYLFDLSGRVIQFKCKPETIEHIHFASSGGINYNSILATCWNTFENFETLSWDNVKTLLLEEFSETQIESRSYAILKAIEQVTKEAEFRERVITEYKKLGVDIILNKREVMRHLSRFFNKQDMRKVHSIIVSFS